MLLTLCVTCVVLKCIALSRVYGVTTIVRGELDGEVIFQPHEPHRYHNLDINNLLNELSHSLQPNKSREMQLHRSFYDICQKISLNLSLINGHVSRISLVGSTAKGVNLPYTSDLDIIIFVDMGKDEIPTKMAEINGLIEHRCRTIFFETYRKKVYDGFVIHSVRVNGIDVDMQIGRHSGHVGHDSTNNCAVIKTLGNKGTKVNNIRSQVTQTIDYIIKSNDSALYAKTLSSSVYEGLVVFTRSQSQYCRSLILLAKLWSNACEIPSFNKGRSFIIELFAIHAATEVEKQSEQPDILQGFKLFLNLIIRSDSVKIIWYDFYSPQDVPEILLSERNLILNPCNPFRNTLRGDRGLQLRRMHPLAKRTLWEIRNAEQQCVSKKVLLRLFGLYIERDFHRNGCTTYPVISRRGRSRSEAAVELITQFVNSMLTVHT